MAFYCMNCLKAIVTDGTPPRPQVCSRECYYYIYGYWPEDKFPADPSPY